MKLHPLAYIIALGASPCKNEPEVTLESTKVLETRREAPEIKTPAEIEKERKRLRDEQDMLRHRIEWILRTKESCLNCHEETCREACHNSPFAVK